MWNLIARTLARPAIANAIIKFAQRTPYEHIHDKDGSLYMGRWWLLKERSWFPYAARIHHIAREDRDRDLHDHPYDYRTIILRGGYVEKVLLGAYHGRYAGETAAARAQHFHKIVAVSDGGVWTLFIYRYRARSNPWGFLVADAAGNVRKKYWWDYLGVRR